LIRSQGPVLLTGATGFIGQRLQRKLVDDGYTIRAIVRPDSSNRQNILPECRVVEGELTDETSVARALSGTRAVIYCAGTVRGSNPADFSEANVNGVAAVLDSMGDSCPETPFLLVSSLAASKPGLSDYSNSKYLGEEIVKSKASVPWTIFRPPAVYGKGDEEMLPVFKLARKGIALRLTTDDQRISLIHADDLSAAVSSWLTSWPSCTGQTFELDDGRPGGYSWEDIVAAAGSPKFRSIRVPRVLLNTTARMNVALSAVTSRAPMLTPGKVNELTQPAWLCDNKPYTLLSGWTPSISLKQGLQMTLNYSSTH
jgi:nucleoside-diphosphate-sugar epimerase